jgi:carbon-monoxide dehydrogenase large subunit
MAQETMARPESETPDHRFVGKPVPRTDATAKVTGKTVYADDMHLPRMLHAKILGAAFAHARIKAIDTSKARLHPGVAAVITADDLPPYKLNASNRRGLIFPKDEVLFYGQPVAAVLAEDPHAEEALGLIKASTSPARGRRPLPLCERLPLVRAPPHDVTAQRSASRDDRSAGEGARRRRHEHRLR